MHSIHTPTPRLSTPSRTVAWRTGALILLAWFYAPTAARPALAATADQSTLIQVLFDDLPDMGGLDANDDGALTVADVLLLPPAIPATPTTTPTVRATPTATFTPTRSPTATATPTASPTATDTLTPTPVGLLFAGAISELVPHGMGDTLVYRVTDPVGKVTTETTVVVSTDGAGGFVLDDLEVSGQQVRKHEVQTYSDTGTQLLFFSYTDPLHNIRTICRTPLLRLMTPFIAGQLFSTTVICDVRQITPDRPIGFGDRTDTFTPIELVDSVTVPAGTYTNVVHLHGTTDLSGDLETDEVYLAPGIGPILQLATSGGQTTKRELTGGTICGVPVAR